MPGPPARHRDISALRDLPLFTSREAREARLSGHDLAILARRQLVLRIARGWYSCLVDASEEELHVLRTVANLRLLGGSAVASGMSAALVHGLPLARCDLSTVEIATEGVGHGRTRQGVRVSEHATKGAQRLAVHVPLVGTSVPVVDPASAIVGTALSGATSAALVAADHAVRHEVCTSEQIQQALAARHGFRGIARARTALEIVEGKHESPGETLTAMILREGPWDFEPQLRVSARGRNFRLDFALREHKVAIEFDGEGKYTGPEVMEDQLARQAALEAEGWVFVRLGWADLDDPSTLLRRIADAVAIADAR